MAAEFDPENRDSWYFGPLTREETNNILLSERDSGVFLVRDSGSIKGDYVLCVREDVKVSHYIINKIQVAGTIRYRIGEQEFPDLPGLLNFYKTHYLDTTSLIRIAPREKYIAKYAFAGRDPEDLPFDKGDILTILTKDEDQWWTAKNEDGKMGQIPVPYIQKYDPDIINHTQHEQPGYMNPVQAGEGNVAKLPLQKKLPAKAVVVQRRVPNAYDTSALRLEEGDIVVVTATNINGQWEGELNGKKGHFPFTHVRFMETESEED